MGKKKKISYNGFDIIRYGCDYSIKGHPAIFGTLEKVKAFIDSIKNGVTSNIYPF